MGRKLLLAGMSVVFFSWAYFQLNDPDALPWVIVYAGTAVFALLALFRRLAAWAPWLFGAVAIVWALAIAWDIGMTDGFGYTFEHFLDEVEGERAREMLGLVITAAWNGYLGIYVRRR